MINICFRIIRIKSSSTAPSAFNTRFIIVSTFKLLLIYTYKLSRLRLQTHMPRRDKTPCLWNSLLYKLVTCFFDSYDTQLKRSPVKQAIQQRSKRNERIAMYIIRQQHSTNNEVRLFFKTPIWSLRSRWLKHNNHSKQVSFALACVSRRSFSPH